ncbi:MAG: hypothetical protein M3R24_20405 [Chloroflexota bacterium]|nr:hypothetical protein [Chloroflexota bacterium]
MTSIFTPALDTLHNQNNCLFGPMSFQHYLLQHQLGTAKTAQSISIDSLERLHPELRQNDTMVIRLGATTGGTNTQFALAKVQGRLKDFFLFDNALEHRSATTFLPTVGFRQLYPYQLLAPYSETSLVNLGFASGLISTALRLDESETLTIPATGQSTFTFRLRPHSLFDTVLDHNNGQVQVDALFLGKRGNKEYLFVLEAKTRSADRSLAKHKLVYPILALARQVPHDIPIIPVYLKVFHAVEGLIYHVVECNFPNHRDHICALDELQPVNYTALILPFFTFGMRPG